MNIEAGAIISGSLANKQVGFNISIDIQELISEKSR